MVDWEVGAEPGEGDVEQAEEGMRFVRNGQARPSGGPSDQTDGHPADPHAEEGGMGEQWVRCYCVTQSNRPTSSPEGGPSGPPASKGNNVGFTDKPGPARFETALVGELAAEPVELGVDAPVDFGEFGLL